MEPRYDETWRAAQQVSDSSPAPVGASDDDGFLTPDKARKARERAEHGHVFTLQRTGGKALVRRFIVSDHATIGTLPAAMQQRVLDGLNKINSAANAVKSDGHISRDIAMQNMKANEQAINAYCVAAFIRPPLIFSEGDRTEPNQVLVTDIDLYDRQMVFLWGNTDHEEAAKRVAPFPDESVSDVATR
jgi:hypothetical protein